MSKLYTCTERVYHYPGNGSPRVFVADKGDQISWDVAVKLGLVKDEPKADAKKVAPADVQNKAVKPATKQASAKTKE